MKLLTVNEVAEILRLSRSKVYELIAGGEIVPYRIGGAVRISEDDFREYLSGCREEKAEAPRKAPRHRLKHLSR